ncbi:MAG: hypothetical protein K0Q66_1473 [Chitinophagaceae bacterium]|jgi:hypothetical protein|nr:hypothetical protein [Chitinophagaceae bacterium]
MKNHDEKPMIACTPECCVRPEVNIDDHLAAAMKTTKEVSGPPDPKNNELVTKPRP